MYRRRGYYRQGRGPMDELMDGIAYILIVIFALYFISNPKGALSFILLVAACAVAIIFLIKYLRRKHFAKVLSRLKSLDQEKYLKDYIGRWGQEDGKNKGWTFRKHDFDWDRINDLKKILKERGITQREKDVFSLLRFYIQEKEEALTRGIAHAELQKFTRLSGSDFENLLYRLFEKMGYLVERIGHTGDQGGDLIASRGGERILIQAKCYKDWSTGNAAVQQVVGAMQHYNCNGTMVVTTSHFTAEAITLAKDNRTELVSKEHLQELLQTYLGESWC